MMMIASASKCSRQEEFKQNIKWVFNRAGAEGTDHKVVAVGEGVWLSEEIKVMGIFKEKQRCFEII